MNDEDLKKFAYEFRQGILEKKKSNSMCFVICAPLVSLINVYGVECEISEGWVGNYHHYWIDLLDGRILDPTADQFKTPDGEDMPPVYLGEKPEWYEVEK